jgi:hypothetical protein
MAERILMGVVAGAILALVLALAWVLVEAADCVASGGVPVRPVIGFVACVK